MVRDRISSLPNWSSVYIAGFSRYWRFTKLSLLMILPIGLYGIVMGYHVIAALLQNHMDTLVVPVLMRFFPSFGSYSSIEK